jgi:hypothetical protein
MLIVGPVLNDLLQIGLDGQRVDISTAFYSTGVLRGLRPQCDKLRVMCRLDLSSPYDWANGFVAPDALLDMLRRTSAAGAQVSVYTSPAAHAKVYIGSQAALVGSANLTMTGFGGGPEVLQRTTRRRDLRALQRYLNTYATMLRRTSLDELDAHVRRFRRIVSRSQKRHSQDRLPPTSRDSNRTLGDYDSSVRWLGRQRQPAARETYERAHGKSNLQGHIHGNFYGLRQFLISYPHAMRRFAAEQPNAYKLSRDSQTEDKLKFFVGRHAVDEDDFRLDTWRTYLPRECGGRAGRHGGTIGNLNRMLPLVARYLAAQQA